jgi:uncharacterized repeat protein (TIGR01451 family)
MCQEALPLPERIASFLPPTAKSFLGRRRKEIDYIWRGLVALLTVVVLGALPQAARAQSLVQTVNLGTTALQSDAVAVNPATNLIYVVTQTGTSSAGTTYVVDGKSGAVVGTISDTSGGNAYQPDAIAIDPQRNMVYVANLGATAGGSITVINGATNAIAETVTDPSFNGPDVLVMDVAHNTLYAANHNSSTISAINFNSNPPAVSHITTPSFAQALAINPANNLLYASVNTGVAIYSLPSGTLQNTVSVGGFSYISVDTSVGIAYAASQSGVYAIAGTGNSADTVLQMSDPNGAAQAVSVAVNSNTHRAYVAYQSGSNACATGCISVYQGTSNTFVSGIAYAGTVSTPTVPKVVAVDTDTDVVYAPQKSGTVTVINGSTLARLVDLAVGGSDGMGVTDGVAAVNPVTHRAYVGANNDLGPTNTFPAAIAGLAVIDGNTYNADANSPLQVPANPYSLAINPFTNQLYVTDYNAGELTAIDANSASVINSIQVGTNPSAVAVDPVQNVIYVANTGSNSVSVVDGASFSVYNTITFNPSITPDTLAVNPVANQVFGGSSATGLTFQFSGGVGASGQVGAYAPVFGGTDPIATAVNLATGKNYQLIHGPNNPFLTVADPAVPYGYYLNVCYTAANGMGNPVSTPISMDVNPNTDTVYALCSNGTIEVATGASGFTNGQQSTINPPSTFQSYTAVAVNPVTNMIYVADYGAGDVYVINGATHTIVATVVVGTFPVSIAVSQASNKIYVLGAGAPDTAATITEIDGASNAKLRQYLVDQNTPGDVNIPGSNGVVYPEVLANPVSGMIYSLAGLANEVFVLDENVPVTTCPGGCLQTAITTNGGFNPDAAKTAIVTAPSFKFTVTNNYNNGATLNAVYYQLDTQQGQWLQATAAPASGTFVATLSGVVPGLHILYAFATDYDDANSSASSGLQASPLIGTIASFAFLDAPPLSSAGPTSLSFPNTSVGATSSDQVAAIGNDGSVPLNYSYTITGPNASDFAVDQTYYIPCATSGTLQPVPQGTPYCYAAIQFTPQTQTTETATLTFFSNSLQTTVNGPNNVAQTVQLTGTGVVPIPMIYEGPGNPSYITSGVIGFNGQANATFACSLVVSTASPNYAPCTSPYNYSGLSENTTYTFYVTQTVGGVTSSPATTTWQIVPSQVSVTFAGNGTGAVTSTTPAGLNCTANCTVQFNGVPVTLTATPTGGSTFAGWSNVTPDPNDNCSGTGPCTLQTGDAFQSVTATFTAPAANVTLTVRLIGTGNGNIGDTSEQLDCTDTAGVTSGTCTAVFAPGSNVDLFANATQPSTFGGWSGPCSGTQDCAFTINSSTTVTASFVPSPQIINLPFTVGSNETQMATYDCPSNANPTPQNPCTDPNAHAIAFTLPQVNTPFTLTVKATEVPPNVANGICPAGDTPSQDFDCRFTTFFTYSTDNSGNATVPLCYPYANGNCVLYSIYTGTPGTEPNPTFYTGPVSWLVTYNDDTFVAPATWNGSTPRLYEDPDTYVLPNSPYGTNCSAPMLTGDPGTPTSDPPLYCQFVFDITTFYDPNKKVDSGIGGKTKVFSDAVVAIPPATAGFVTVTSTPDAASVTAGSPIGFTIAISNGSAATANNATLNDPLPSGTNITWMISPAYNGPSGGPGPGCIISGAVGSQVLNCNFGNVAQSASFSFHLQSASSSAGNYINQSYVTATDQQVLSVVNIVVNVATATFSNLTPSQAITAGTSAISLSGIISSGNMFPTTGETVGVTINGITQQATIVTGGAFQTSFPTANIPASATPYPITYSYPGDGTFGPATDSSTTLTVNPPSSNFTLTVSLTGTGSGSVTDGGQLNCTDTAGVVSGSCVVSYAQGTVVNLTATPTQPSTFGGWSGGCAGTQACSVTMNSSQSVTASFVPPPQTVTLQYTPGTNETQMATFDCPSNPNPTPTNPCTDPNAHAISFTVPQVNTAFPLTVKVTEVPPDVANGICPAGDTPTQDFDCRFKSFFTYQTRGNGDTVVPLCFPYANGNCVVYSIYSGTPGAEPPLTSYTGPVSWLVTYNDDTFVPPSPWAGSTPRLYEDPDTFVLPNSPYGTNCSTPMLMGNPGVPTSPAIYCQFVFDITTIYYPTKKVDSGIGGKTKVFSDAVVAIPPATAGFVTVTSTPDAATVTAGSPIGFTIAISNGSTATANNAVLSDPLPSGTNINWMISPAYGGPGTCAITGAVGSQVLNCSFGNVAVNAAFSLHLLSASSSVGNYINQSYVTATDQQVLSVVNIMVQSLPTPTFGALTPSQSVPAGTASVMLSGTIGSGSTFPAPGEKVTITIDGISQQATIGGTATPATGAATGGTVSPQAATGNGAFSTVFSLRGIPASSKPYPITYSYAGDAKLGPASNSSTTLTLNAVSQTITFTTNAPPSAPHGSKFTVAATATSGLPVAYTSSGACGNSGATYTMTAATGTCLVIVNQGGNGTYSPAPQKTESVNATKAASVTAITSNTPNPSNVGQSVTVGFKVSGAPTPSTAPTSTGTPTGSVTVTATLGSTHVTCAGALASGTGSCAVTLSTVGVWTLTATYPGDGNFTGSSTASGASQTVNAAGSMLKFSPSTLNFGTTYPGSTVIRSLTITNSGSTMVTFSDFDVSPIAGDDSNGFVGVEFCPHTLNSGKSCTIFMSFTGDSNVTKTHAANLLITDNAAGSPQSIPMTAVVINPIATFSPTSLNFGNQKSNTTSAAKSVILKNTGTTPLLLNGLSISGNFASATGTTCTGTTSLAVNATCTLNVVFKPTSRGSKSGSITVSDNAQNSPQSVSLSGNGN